MRTLILSSSLSVESKSYLLCRKTYKILTEKVDCKLFDARSISLRAFHNETTEGMKKLKQEIKNSDNIIIGMGVHCYSINDSLKIILDNCFEEAEGKFFGILCAAGGEKSYLATQHLSQICMNEWRMIQLPRIVYATTKDFKKDKINSIETENRIKLFAEEFYIIGGKLLN